MRFTGLFVLTLAAGTAAPVLGQDALVDARSKTTGIVLGAYLNGTALSAEGEDVESGGGLSIRLGYGLNDRFELFTELHAASIRYANVDDTYGLAHFDLGARLNLGQTTVAWRPYLDAALTGRAASFSAGGGSTLDLRGSGLSLGGGVHYFFNPKLALDAGLRLTFGSFSEGRLGNSGWVDLQDGSISGTSSRVNLGLAWRP